MAWSVLAFVSSLPHSRENQVYDGRLKHKDDDDDACNDLLLKILFSSEFTDQPDHEERDEAPQRHQADVN